ncbi:MAG: aminotransferase class and family protein [Rhizobacter sp.]|nr:aminotransferase class and family protein [Rhizobacter sp.]
MSGVVNSKLSQFAPDWEAPLKEQLHRFIKQSVARGVLRSGMQMPSTRDYAKTCGVSRNTVVAVYQRLVLEGYFEARVGAGTFVRNRDVVSTQAVSDASATSGVADLSERGRSFAAQSITWGPRAAATIAFRSGQPALEAFPFKVWHQLGNSLAQRTVVRLATYQPAQGHEGLRKAIAAFLGVSRGIRCSANEVLVTTGSQQGLHLIASMLLDPGDQAVVEDPGYIGAASSLRAHQAVVCPVPVDAQGLQVSEAVARYPDAKLAVVTPTHQFPTGATLSLARRRALVDWADRQRRWIVEDDYDGEFQYGGAGIPALRSLDRTGRVLYVGSFSKMLHPDLRLGFLVLPLPLMAAFVQAKALIDRHTPALSQEVLSRFILEGHMQRHLRRMRELYLERQGVLIASLADTSDGRIQLRPSNAGMHLFHDGGEAMDDTRLSALAHAGMVEVAPASAFCLRARRRGLMFGYAAFDAETIRAAAIKLRSCWAKP